MQRGEQRETETAAEFWGFFFFFFSGFDWPFQNASFKLERIGNDFPRLQITKRKRKNKSWGTVAAMSLIRSGLKTFSSLRNSVNVFKYSAIVVFFFINKKYTDDSLYEIIGRLQLKTSWFMREIRW